MPLRIVSFISAVILFAWAPAASAQTWSAVGFNGSVDEADTSIHVFGSNGAVAIRSSARGTLNVRYPVQTLRDLLVGQDGDCPDMRVSLRDTGPGARVIVRFVAMDIFPGGGFANPEGTLTVLGEIDSDTLRPIPDPNQYRSASVCLATTAPGIENLIDYSFFAYFVDVQLIKTTAGANPGLRSLQICPSQDFCDP